jgi:hypothetical protein
MRDIKLTMRYFDNNSKVALSFDGDLSEIYNTGNLLLDFIATDFDKILNKIESIEKSILSERNITEKTVAESYSIIKNLLNELDNAHPFYREFLEMFNEETGKNENTAASLIERMNLLRLFIHDLGQHIYYNKYISSTYSKVISKCYSTDDAETKCLSPLQRYEKFQLSFIAIITGKDNVTYYVQSDETNALETYLYEIHFDINLKAALYLEFLKLISSNIKVNKCSICDRFFIPAGRSDMKFCNRIIDDTGKTCKDIGANKLYRKKKLDDPVDNLYEKIRSRNRGRRDNGKLKNNEYKKWNVKALKLRDDARDGIVTFESYEEIMNYQPEKIREWIKEE